jgi:hypothetical protein
MPARRGARKSPCPLPGQLGGVFTSAQITRSQAPRVILLIDNLGLPRLEVDDTGRAVQRWDTLLFKTIKFGERASLQLRLETFNTFNHGSPNLIVTDVSSPFFGRVTGYHISREVQIEGKINF